MPFYGIVGPMDVARLVADLGYPAVALAIFAEDFGLPVPGETVLVAAAIAASQGQLNIFAVAGVGFVAAVLGDNVGFAIGHYGGRRFVLRVGKRLRLGGRELVSEDRLARGERFFTRFGPLVIVGALGGFLERGCVLCWRPRSTGSAGYVAGGETRTGAPPPRAPDLTHRAPGDAPHPRTRPYPPSVSFPAGRNGRRAAGTSMSPSSVW